VATSSTPKNSDNNLQQLREQRDQATEPAERERLDAQVRDAESQAQTGESGAQSGR
jgi:hypothetical protein